MVSIRLARAGAKKRPFYHIVVSENDRIPTGRAIEILGFVNPIATSGETVRINAEKAKAFADRYGLPTAAYAICEDAAAARAALDRFDPPYVVKADGLAAGKGVVVAPIEGIIGVKLKKNSDGTEFTSMLRRGPRVRSSLNATPACGPGAGLLPSRY